MVKFGFIFLCLMMVLFSENLIAQVILKGKVESKNNISVDCQIVVSSKDKFEPYRMIETYDSTFGYKKLYPNQIKGYQLKGDSFRSIVIKDTASNSTIQLFAKVIAKGKATLLYSPVFDDLVVDIYFFKKENEKYYHVYREGEIVDLGDGPYKLYVFNEGQVFSSFYNWYFQDCTRVSGAIKSRSYTMGAIENLFKDYNKCF